MGWRSASLGSCFSPFLLLLTNTVRENLLMELPLQSMPVDRARQFTSAMAYSRGVSPSRYVDYGPITCSEIYCRIMRSGKQKDAGSITDGTRFTEAEHSTRSSARYVFQEKFPRPERVRNWRRRAFCAAMCSMASASACSLPVLAELVLLFRKFAVKSKGRDLRTVNSCALELKSFRGRYQLIVDSMACINGGNHPLNW